MKVTHAVTHYDGTEQWHTYLIWSLLLTMRIYTMLWNETVVISTYSLGGGGGGGGGGDDCDDDDDAFIERRNSV